MPRGGGSIQPGRLYHLISRFVGNEWLMASNAERKMYLTTLGLALALSDWRCLAYALMSSHVHLAFIAGRDRLASWLRPAHTEFANWLNSKRERIGAVFVKGPYVKEVQVEGVGALINYIHHNPVRAGVVRRAVESNWTSHRAFVGAGPRPRFLDIETAVATAGFADGAAFGVWAEGTFVSRQDVDAFVVKAAKRVGRPKSRHVVAQPALHATSLARSTEALAPSTEATETLLAATSLLERERVHAPSLRSGGPNESFATVHEALRTA